MCSVLCVFFFFKQKTAYEMRISDWSSDVCSSDLNRIPGVPKHYLRAELLYKHPGGFYAGPNVEWAPGHYYADNANTLTVNPYALLNLKAGFDAGKHGSVYVEGRNLTDKRYISTVAIAGVASAASEIFNPGTGRAVSGGVRFTR